MIWKKFHCIQFMVVYQTRTDLLLPKVPLNLRFKILKEELKFSISFSIRDISWLKSTPCSPFKIKQFPNLSDNSFIKNQTLYL